jgi:CheY-like chemotaxis protein
MTPLYDSEGQLTGYTKILRDMTAQKQAVAELDRVNEELQEASRRKDEFLALLAHELRNPLAPIRNGLQIVKTVISREGAGDAAIEMMERQLSQMVRLIDDLLDVSRINQGKLHLQTERVPLATLVQQAAEAIQPAIERMQQKLTVELPPEPVFLNADPVRMAQVLSNLLTNSCKFTERGGRIRFSAWREGEEAVIRVQDTGIGIPAEKLASIFDMFVQVDRNAERSQGGLGLGLSLVKSLVEMHGGRVEAWSEGIGRGSEFIVRLPVAAEPAGGPRPAAKTAPATTSKMRILVVDDNRDAAQSLAMLLRLEGHDVRTVYDGPSALELASTFQPDIIFQDIGMPGMSGYEVGWRLRQGFSKDQMMLVALTGYGTEEDRRRTALAGFDLHLVKPVEPETLQHLVRAFAAKK